MSKGRVVVGWRARMQQEIAEREQRVRMMAKVRLPRDAREMFAKIFLPHDRPGFERAIAKACATKASDSVKADLKRIKDKAARIAAIEDDPAAREAERRRAKARQQSAIYRAQNYEKLHSPEARAAHAATVARWEKRNRAKKNATTRACKARKRARMLEQTETTTC